jgi:hypothetical protein
MEKTKTGLWRRKNYLIHPRFQLTIVLANVLCMMLGFAGILVVVRGFFGNMISLGTRAGFPPGHAYFTFVDIQLQAFYGKLVGAFLVSVGLSAILSIWISHRAVGPIHKLITHLRALKTRPTGEPATELKFRSGDLFSELPDLVNEATGVKANGKPKN